MTLWSYGRCAPHRRSQQTLDGVLGQASSDLQLPAMIVSQCMSVQRHAQASIACICWAEH